MLALFPLYRLFLSSASTASMTIFRFQVLSWALIILIFISRNRANTDVNFNWPSPSANWMVGKQQNISWQISSSDGVRFSSSSFGIFLEQDILPDRGNTSIAPKYNVSSDSSSDSEATTFSGPLATRRQPTCIYGIIYLFYMLLFSIMLSYMLLYIKAD